MRPLDREKVREWRNRRMLSQQEVADLAGTSLFTIQRIERGEGNVRPKTGRAVALALGVPVEELFPKAQPPLWSDEGSEGPSNDDPGRGFSLFAKAIRAAADEWEAAVADQDISDAEIAGQVEAIRGLYTGIAGVMSPQDGSEPTGWEILTTRETDELLAVTDRLDLALGGSLDRLEKSGYYEDGGGQALTQRRNEIEEWKQRKERRNKERRNKERRETA